MIVFTPARASPGTISIGRDDVVAMWEITRHVIARGYKGLMVLARPGTEPHPAGAQGSLPASSAGCGDLRKRRAGLGGHGATRQGLGLRVPPDIAVTGFDNIRLAASPAYDLTTCRRPITSKAKASVDVLVGRGRQGVVLPGHFVMRGPG